MTAAPGLVTAVRSAKQFLTYVASGPFQYAVAEALALPDSYFDTFRADMLAKRDVLATGLTEAGFEVFRPAGTYFITTDIRPLGADLSKNGDGFAFCRALPELAGVVAIPNAAFYRTPSSTTTGRRARPSYGSRSARRWACWRKRRNGSVRHSHTDRRPPFRCLPGPRGSTYNFLYVEEVRS